MSVVCAWDLLQANRHTMNFARVRMDFERIDGDETMMREISDEVYSLTRRDSLKAMLTAGEHWLSAMENVPDVYMISLDWNETLTLIDPMGRRARRRDSLLFLHSENLSDQRWDRRKREHVRSHQYWRHGCLTKSRRNTVDSFLVVTHIHVTIELSQGI